MGEWSRSIGEKGEKIVKFLFEEILNFNSLVENQTIICVKGDKHKLSGTEKRNTHGIDGLIYNQSPVEDSLLDIGIISSKYTALEYPNSPSSQFKVYLKDLAYTIECFNKSKIKSDINFNFNSITKSEIIGILVWLSNKSDASFDIVSKVDSILIDSDLNFDKIILLDNNKVNFLYESIYKTKEIFKTEYVDFVYHNSSLNFNSMQENSYGKPFPLNYLYSDIIPLRVEDNGNVNLIIYINDDYNSEHFEQILNFAKLFDHLNTLDKVIIRYKRYDYLENESSVKERLINFSNYRLNENLVIQKFPSDFRN
ncbi:hypothetical protein [Chryseobacterium nepalense]|uniref:GapS4a family protein n=1 Tax=Chryseobacterium nepalense TaxID=1854498 RepID=UPI002E0A8748|nr:hypothetical protein [Chryseobacterium nepalense]